MAQKAASVADSRRTAPRQKSVSDTFSSSGMDVIHNRPLHEIRVGDRFSMEHTLSSVDIDLFAAMSGDVHQQRMNAQSAASTRCHGVIAHRMWAAALISAVLGTRLSGAVSIYERRTHNFRAPIRAGDTLRTTVKVIARDGRQNVVKLDCTCVNQRGETVITCEATVTAPRERIERSMSLQPELMDPWTCRP
jgi:acyl dehydratase